MVPVVGLDPPSRGGAGERCPSLGRRICGAGGGVVLPNGYSPTIRQLVLAVLSGALALPALLARSRRRLGVTAKSMKRVSRHWWTGLGLVALVEAVVLAVIPGKRGWFDVGVYYGTVHHWIAGGHIYDYVQPSSEYGFTYPPFAAICMLPMMLFTWHEAVAVSVVLTVIASAALLTWLVDPIAQRHGWHRGFAFCVAAMLFAGLEPVRETISFGQVTPCC